MAGGFLKAVSNEELVEEEETQAAIDEESSEDSGLAIDQLASFVRRRFETLRNHRSSEKLTERYLQALRSYKGEYSAKKQMEISQFGGSDVFAKITAVKCRGATALLRDVFLGADRSWGVDPTPVPELPEDVTSSVDQLIAMEMQEMQARGIAVPPEIMEKRRTQLMDAAYKAAYKRAREHAGKAELKLDDVLTEGRFYEAMVEFLTDLPLFPFACIKGPVVQHSIEVKWTNGQMQTQQIPRMFWYRVSPFDLYFSGGASTVEDAEVIERVRLSRADLNALIGVPGYDEDSIRGALEEYSEGLHSSQYQEGESERADLEHRELRDENFLDSLEYHGTIPGQLLLDYGFTEEQIPDAVLDYSVVCWVVGRHVIKVQLNPNPKKRHPYYITSFEKIPGSLYGSGIPEIIEDVQNVANATLRSLVNNLSIASGPQVSINEDRLSPSTNPDNLYPWKRWRFISDPMGDQSQPINFFQPTSNARELLEVYQAMTNIADETSAIPRYITGSEKVGGAARTASGLSMLMNNASKVLQNVAASIDRDVMQPLLQDLYIMLMLTDTTGLLRGDEKIVVKGVSVAMQKDTDRMRRLEFLQITANPLDSQIVGTGGRAAILRTLAEDLGMPGDDIVPSEQELVAIQQQQQQMLAAQAQGGQAPSPGSAPAQGPEGQFDNQFRTGV
jgi:hypothetical protein